MPAAETAEKTPLTSGQVKARVESGRVVNDVKSELYQVRLRGPGHSTALLLCSEWESRPIPEHPTQVLEPLIY